MPQWIKFTALPTLAMLALAWFGHVCYTQTKFDFESRALTAAQGEALLAERLAKLKPETVSPRDISLAFALSKRLERIDAALGAKSYSQFSAIFAKSNNAQLHKMAAVLEGQARKMTLVGKPLELLPTTDIAGREFDWSKYRGKVVLIDFWATWCGDCLREMPNLRKTHAQYQAQGLEIVGISIDDELADVQRYQKSKPLPWTQLHDAGGQVVAMHYGVEAVPTAILIDREGKVVLVTESSAEIQRELARLLK